MLPPQGGPQFKPPEEPKLRLKELTATAIMTTTIIQLIIIKFLLTGRYYYF